MSPFHGRGSPPPDTAANWLFGGDRKRRIVEALADSTSEDGLPASVIENRSGASRVTVFETLRALRAIRAVDQPSRGRYRLDRDDEVGAALAKLVSAARRLGDRAVDRPPRARSRPAGS